MPDDEECVRGQALAASCPALVDPPPVVLQAMIRGIHGDSDGALPERFLRVSGARFRTPLSHTHAVNGTRITMLPAK